MQAAKRRKRTKGTHGAAGTVALKGNQNRWLSELFFQSGSRNADDTMMPALSGKHQHPFFQKPGILCRLLCNFFQNANFLCLACLITAFQFLCQFCRFIWVFTEKQFHSRFG